MPTYSRQFIDIAPNGIPAKIGFTGTIASTTGATFINNQSGSTTTGPSWTYTHGLTYKELNPVTLHTVPAGAKDEIHLFMGFKRIMSLDYFDRYAFEMVDSSFNAPSDSITANGLNSDNMPDITCMMAPDASYSSSTLVYAINLKHVIIGDSGTFVSANYGSSSPYMPNVSNDISDFKYGNYDGADKGYGTKAANNYGIRSQSDCISLFAGSEEIPLRINGGQFKQTSGGIITKDVVGTVDTYPYIYNIATASSTTWATNAIADIQAYGYGYGVSSPGGGGGISGQKIVDGLILNSGQTLKTTLRHFHVRSRSTGGYYCPSGIFRAYFWGYVNRIS